MVPNPIDELIKDHLFQHNAVIWLVQPSLGSNGIRPILYEQGFSMLAIARLFALPPDVQAAVDGSSLVAKRAARPDVMLTHDADKKFVFVECKENSFGPASTTARQARTLLLASGSRAAEMLGLDASEVSACLLSYFVPDDNVIPLTETLERLHVEMEHAGLPLGHSSVFGLMIRNNEFSLLVMDDASSFVGLESGVHPFMTYEPGTDPRPFYFLPFDPGLDQSPEERDKCKLDLFKRIQQHVIVEVGQIDPPAEVRLTADSLLDRAYLGMYMFWEDRDDKVHLRRLCNRYLNRLARAIHTSSPRTMVQDSASWTVIISDQDHHDRVMNALMRFGPESTDLLENMPQLPDSYDENDQDTS